MFAEISRLLSNGEKIVVATVLSKSGSAPRATGARMIIGSQGSTIGSIGGGLLEALTLKSASDVFSSRRAQVQAFSLTNAEAGKAGMLCGGQVEILLDFIDPSDPARLNLYQHVSSQRSAEEEAWLITRIPSSPFDERPVAQCLAKRGHIAAAAGCDSLPVSELVEQISGNRPSCITVREDRYLVEPLSGACTVYIFGAGHIGEKLAALTAMTGFVTVVLDDRDEFANARRFPEADRIIVLSSFEHAMAQLDIHRQSFIVIATRGHMHDKIILEQALKTKAGYIGMIGSTRKREIIYSALAAEGFGEADLARAHCPIGLAIGAETPEEIAVSIVAELIQARHKGMKVLQKDAPHLLMCSPGAGHPE